MENSVFYEMEYIPPIAFFCLRKISSHPKPFRTFTLIIYTKGLKNKIHCIFYRPCFITSWLKMALVLSHRGLHCFIPLYFSVKNFSQHNSGFWQHKKYTCCPKSWIRSYKQISGNITLVSGNITLDKMTYRQFHQFTLMKNSGKKTK